MSDVRLGFGFSSRVVSVDQDYLDPETEHISFVVWVHTCHVRDRESQINLNRYCQGRVNCLWYVCQIHNQLSPHASE
jgi:hypothetical protein